MKKIELIPLSKLTLLDKNPRTISKDQMTKLCKSIKDDPDFLYLRPILVNLSDATFYVYAGNQRVRAAKKLKMKEIPCIVEHDIHQDLQDARCIKDNKTFGEFDFDLLANEWDIDLLLDCGFRANELIGSDQEITEEKEDKQKKCKVCPKCGEDI